MDIVYSTDDMDC